MNDYQDEEGTLPEGCQMYSIPAGQLTYFDGGVEHSIRINDAGLYLLPGCGDDISIDSSLYEKDPFFGSVAPVAYTAAATTVMSWLLLILLFLSQKSRPWLQKVTVLFVAIMLTVGLTSTNNKLEQQYNNGYQDADELRSHVFGGTSFRILRVISEVLLWMAHVQVALRLFTDIKEKLIIKAVGGLLIVIFVIFVCLSDFLGDNPIYRNRFEDPLYVIAMTTEILIVSLYALSVFVYSLRKWHYAYNLQIWPIATLALASVIAPLVFIIMYMISYWLAGWSGISSSVCSAAASVAVLDWVDAIERLEKEEQKHAFMGRKFIPKTVDNKEQDLSTSDTKFPLSVFRRHWIISRGGSASTEYDRQDSRPHPFNTPSDLTTPPPPPPVFRQLTTSDTVPETVPEDSESILSSSHSQVSEVVIHHHPVKRNTSRQNTDSDSDSDDSDVYIVSQQSTRPPPINPFPVQNNEESSVNDSEELPPNFFAPVHGFEPGDYFDDKSPVGLSGDNAGPSNR